MVKKEAVEAEPEAYPQEAVEKLVLAVCEFPQRMPWILVPQCALIQRISRSASVLRSVL